MVVTVSTALLQPIRQLIQRPRIDDILWFQPGAMVNGKVKIQYIRAACNRMSDIGVSLEQYNLIVQ